MWNVVKVLKQNIYTAETTSCYFKILWINDLFSSSCFIPKLYIINIHPLH